MCAFGREIIEVATFRAAANHADDDSAHDQEGRIIRRQRLRQYR